MSFPDRESKGEEKGPICEKDPIEPERVEMFNLSAGEGPRFAEIAFEMVERIKALGPSPLRLNRAA